MVMLRFRFTVSIQSKCKKPKKKSFKVLLCNLVELSLIKKKKSRCQLQVIIMDRSNLYWVLYFLEKLYIVNVHPSRGDRT